MILTVKKPTFFYLKPPFKIYFLNGGIFYVSTKKASGFFSLPVGNYDVDKNIVVAENHFRKIPKLPKFERNIKRPKKFKLILCENPAKCSVKLSDGRIYFDRNLWNSLTKFQRTFILLHEYGHYFYKNEKYCDMYAKANLLKLGFNISQVSTVDFNILSNSINGFERKCETFEFIRKNYK